MSAHQRSTSQHKADATRQRQTAKAVAPVVQTVEPAMLQNALLDPLSASPEAILSIQRLYGNRAVQRMLASTPHSPDEDEVQREAAGSSLQGGPLASDLSQAIHRSRGGGASLDRSFGAKMSSAFGTDFSGVRVHTDRQAEQLNRSVSAKAFTLGSDIYFSRGTYNPASSGGQELLAHELTHVVQQGGGKSNRVQAKLSVGPAGDQYEQEADRVAKQVLRHSARPTVQRAPVARVQLEAAPALQRKFSLNPMKWFKSSPEEERKKQEKKKAKQDEIKASLEDANKYERNLGKYAFNHPKANDAAKTVNQRLLDALIPEFKQEEEAQQKLVGETFGGTGQKYAGNVGKEFSAVWGMLQSGNLRERMTAVYNAMFGRFKEIFLDLIKRSAWDEAEKRGFDVRKLKIRKRQLGGFFKGGNLGRKKDTYGKPGDYDIYRDPRNPFDRKKLSSMESGLLTKTTRYEKPKGEDTITKRTVGELEEGRFKAGLSEREKKFMFPTKNTSEDLSGERLSWEEGGSKWIVNNKSEWVQKLTNELRMPVIAGPSGTALRFFQMWEWLKKPVKSEDWRLALLGWMLVENDHSFHEIMQMGADYGAPYKSGQEAYRYVHPLTTGELRHNVCVDAKYPGLFPDEIAYHRKLDAGGFKLMAPYKEEMDQHTKYAKLIKDQFGMQKNAYEKSGLPHLLKGVTAYTTIAYQIMNIVAGSNPLVAKIRIAYMLSKNRKRTFILECLRKELRGETLSTGDDAKFDAEWKDMSFADRNICFVLAHSPDVTASELIEESKEHNKQTAYGLKLLPKFQGTVYRGESNIGMPYKKGKQIRLSKFLSTSRKTDFVKDYAKAGRFLTPLALIIETKSGRDVNAVTVNESEKVRQGKKAASLDEVVLLPGTTLSVESEPEVDKRWDLKAVKLKEVGEGAGEDVLQQEITGPLVKGEEEPEVKKPKGRPYTVTGDITGGTVPPDANVRIPAGSVLEVLDAKYPDHIVDEATDWVKCAFEDETVYVIAYDLNQNAKPQVGLVEPPKKLAGPEQIKQDNLKKFAHIAGGKHPIKFPAGRQLAVYKDYDTTDAETLKFDAEQPARLVVFDMGTEQGRCRLEFSGKTYYVNLTDVFDAKGAVMPEGPKVEAQNVKVEEPKVLEQEPDVDIDRDTDITKIFTSGQLGIMLASSDDLEFVVSMGQIDASQLKALSQEQVEQLANYLKLKVDALQKQIQELA